MTQYKQQVTYEKESWKQLEAGRLQGALTAELAEAAPDAERLALLRRLGEVLESLREKRYAHAVKGAAALEPVDDFELEPLCTGVSTLEKSGKHLGLGEAEEALTLLNEVLHPLLIAERETQRGTAYVFLGETETAEAAFRSAAELDPRHYRALTNLGNLQLEAGHTDEAIVLYERAIRLNEGFPNAHHNLGVAYRRKGQVNKSVAAIRRAQKVSRRRDGEEARGVVKSFAGTEGRKYLKWVLYAGAALILYFLLRAQGVI